MVYAFVGMPCQIEGLRKLQYVLEEEWAKDIEFTIGLFCRENWVFSCFRALIEDDFGIDMKEIEKFDIKKGKIVIKRKGGKITKIPLKASKPYVRINCKVCFDFAAELADISVGSVDSPNGWSTVIVRTERGMKILKEAEKEGYIEVKLLDNPKLTIKLSTEKKEEALKESLLRKEYGFEIKHFKTYDLSFEEIKSQASGKNFDNLVEEVIDAGACTSCGTCSAACDKGILVIQYARPELEGECPQDCNLCYLACPRVALPKREIENNIFFNATKDEGFGKYIDIFSVRATDEEILKKAQDGGAVTAILSYALEKGIIDGVISIKSDDWKPVPVISKNREELLNTAGTIYSSSTPLPLLKKVKK